MSDYLVALIVGIVEGLTEFLPVSSTAHIIITHKLLGIPLDDPFWKMFAVVIQLGAILSVVFYFWPRIIQFVQSFVSTVLGKEQSIYRPNTADAALTAPETNPTDRQKTWWQHPLVLVLCSFVVTAIPCFLMDKFIGENLENPLMIAIALIVGGIAMVWIDKTYANRATTESMEQMSMTQAIFIGAAQILAAAFPGTSRSMATIAGGQIMGLSRPAALEFSFFLSIPVMVAASSFKLLQYLLKSEVSIQSEQWITLGIGFITSFFVALAVIAWFMQWVKARGFVPFAIYRIITGALLLFSVLG